MGRPKTEKGPRKAKKDEKKKKKKKRADTPDPDEENPDGVWKYPEAERCGRCGEYGDIMWCETCTASFHLLCYFKTIADNPDDDKFFCNRCHYLPLHLRLFPPRDYRKCQDPDSRIRNEIARNFEAIKYHYKRLKQEEANKRFKTNRGYAPLTEKEALETAFDPLLMKAFQMVNPMDYALSKKYFNVPQDATEHTEGDFINDVRNKVCAGCNIKNVWSPMIKCTMCDEFWHVRCVRPDMMKITPNSDWRCNKHKVYEVIFNDQRKREKMRKKYEAHKTTEGKSEVSKNFRMSIESKRKDGMINESIKSTIEKYATQSEPLQFPLSNHFPGKPPPLPQKNERGHKKGTHFHLGERYSMKGMNDEAAIRRKPSEEPGPSSYNTMGPSISNLPRRSSSLSPGPSSSDSSVPSTSNFFAQSSSDTSGLSTSNIAGPSFSSTSGRSSSNLSGLPFSNTLGSVPSSIREASSSSTFRPQTSGPPRQSFSKLQSQFSSRNSRTSSSTLPGPSSSYHSGSSSSEPSGRLSSNTSGPSTSNIPGTSSTPLFKVPTLNIRRPSIPKTPRSSISNLPGPSSPGTFGPSSSNAPKPSASTSSEPSSLMFSEPSTSNTPGSSTHSIPGPSSSTLPGPSSSNTFGLSSPTVPGPSVSNLPGPSSSSIFGMSSPNITGSSASIFPTTSLPNSFGPSTSNTQGPSSSNSFGPSCSNTSGSSISKPPSFSISTILGLSSSNTPSALKPTDPNIPQTQCSNPDKRRLTKPEDEHNHQPPKKGRMEGQKTKKPAADALSGITRSMPRGLSDQSHKEEEKEEMTYEEMFQYMRKFMNGELKKPKSLTSPPPYLRPRPVFDHQEGTSNSYQGGVTSKNLQHPVVKRTENKKLNKNQERQRQIRMVAQHDFNARTAGNNPINFNLLGGEKPKSLTSPFPYSQPRPVVDHQEGTSNSCHGGVNRHDLQHPVSQRTGNNERERYQERQRDNQMVAQQDFNTKIPENIALTVNVLGGKMPNTLTSPFPYLQPRPVLDDQEGTSNTFFNTRNPENNAINVNLLGGNPFGPIGFPSPVIYKPIPIRPAFEHQQGTSNHEPQQNAHDVMNRIRFLAVNKSKILNRTHLFNPLQQQPPESSNAPRLVIDHQEGTSNSLNDEVIVVDD
ncbi:hypothetical protein CAEBREN_20469 [Caenorhabditis brenneri]|uniref:Zinc finger PHD-type domain-containing protein n=1 Tax=Caenorhabditis brenneri TaxID=135651 RepID=G0MBG5_CAEBE|nr:hypothetical protein CAEBREN_20469 [Caenorhabditis brenneri]